MQKSRRKSIVLCFVAVLLLSLIGIIAFSVKKVANAAGAESSGAFNFSLVTDSEGAQSYSISLMSAAKPTIETIIIPDTYNGLPITEIANNGFMSCANLQKVVLPTTIKKIGNNAFMNCSKLERIILPAIESIGMNAFALCPNLDRTYIPNTVKSVGANVFRNNANTIYVQSSAEEVQAEWQSNWNSYYTGAVVFGIEPENTVGYREVLDTNNEKVIGYEVIEKQWINAPDTDIIIYNSFRPSENLEYLPVLNICEEAFNLYSFANSIIIKDRRADDEEAPEFNHKINIRSNAFIGFTGNNISIEVGVTFDHPSDLQNSGLSEYDGSSIVGDSNGNSTRVFEASSIKSITLPSDIDFIPERMFYDCSYLENIKYYGQIYDGTNTLGTVSKIGAEAFSSCVFLSNLTIPSTVVQVGESAFFYWGDGTNYITKEPLPQALTIDYYEGFLPEGWDENWFGGNLENTEINYKALTEIIVDLQDDDGNKISIWVKPGLEMPEIAKPIRKGYIFKGIFSEKKSYGFQYYTYNMQINRIWKDGDPFTIYADWDAEEYDIIFPGELKDASNTNPTKYTIEDTINIDDVIYKGYNYTFKPNVIEKGTTGDITLDFYKEEIEYKITYELDDWKGNSYPKLVKYTVTQEIIFEKLVNEHYDFYWSPASIPLGSFEDITVTGHWTPKKFNINYDLNDDIMNPATNKSNPSQITYFDTVELATPSRIGYSFIGWVLNGNFVKTLSNIDSDITLKAIWSDKDMDAGADSIYYVTDKTAIVKFSKVFTNYNYEIHVSQSTEYLEVSTNLRKANIFLNIIIDDRNKDFTLKIIGINFTAHTGRNAIVMKSDKMLNLYCENTTISGTDHLTLGEGNGSYTVSNGSSAIYCKHLTIHTPVTLKGGSVSKPSSMGGVAVALAEGGSLTILSNNVTIVGGSAELTLEGQGTYGLAVYANNYNYTTNNYKQYSNVTLKTGTGKKPTGKPTIGY